MPRDLPVGNGSLLVNFDAAYQLRDIYWPYVGQENHTAGHPSRFGVWVEGQFRWSDDAGWQRSLRYLPNTLVTEVTLTHPDLGLTLVCHDAVDFHENLYLRQVTVENHTETAREVRLFFALDLHINGTEVGDSAYYEPERLAVYHYKGKRWFMINAAHEEDGGWRLGIDQWAVGLKEVDHFTGTWQDAEDGVLSGHAVAQGSVDSCVALHLQLPPRGKDTGWFWIAVGDDFIEVTRINRAIRQKGPRNFLDRTCYYWALWLTKMGMPTTYATEGACALYQRSLLLLRAQVDNSGAVIASTDFAVAHESHDTYCYVWPRDGAMAAAALDEAGYAEITRRFYDFCHTIITKEGYLLHKYNPDGSLASSWMGWYDAGKKEIPVQEDETALVLWALWQHFARYRDVEFIKPLYRGLVVRAANWMVTYRDEASGLPQPSWDLWEERRGVHAWTIGATWAGLQAAVNFSEAFGEYQLAETYRRSAMQIKEATEHYLWNAREDRFLRAVRWLNGRWEADDTLDASLCGLWLFGMYPPDDPRIVRTMHAIRERLWVNTPIGGVARYEHDRFQWPGPWREDIAGNPWFICTHWLARWYAEVATTPDALARAHELIGWVCTHALPSGILPEQLNAYDGTPLSVSPLTWSHAECVLTMRTYQRAQERLASTRQ